ncbi:MAG TPA: hypothetical protein PKH07_13695, partial [bacterium]|nr:hypothetical protein [bacterium]
AKFNRLSKNAREGERFVANWLCAGFNSEAKMKTKAPAKKKAQKPSCGLCGKTENLTKTECCGNWICDDEHKYVLFSYATNSCYRNHRRCTLCGFHFSEGHRGSWKTCKTCRSSFEPEMVVWYGTNEFNFEKMPDPPSYEPTKCSLCGAVIRLGFENHSRAEGEYWCEACTEKTFKTRG